MTNPFEIQEAPGPAPWFVPPHALLLLVGAGVIVRNLPLKHFHECSNQIPLVSDPGGFSKVPACGTLRFLWSFKMVSMISTDLDASRVPHRPVAAPPASWMV